MGFGEDLRLFLLLLLNGAVLAAAACAARRWTRDAVQRASDAMLLWYAVQYAAIGIPGVLHVLTPATMALTALAAAGGLFAWARRRPPLPHDLLPSAGRIYLLAAVFVAAFIVEVIELQSLLPMLDSDAITYHVPAAVQWLQTHRIGLFPTWFFNPANTFSPLAGSTFIAWAIAPLGGDTLARFVEAPAIFLTFLAALQLARALGANPWAAAMLAIAGATSRLCTSEIVNARDDMFLAAIATLAVAGCAPERLRERFGPVRIGLALGLTLATKYTALLSLPLLLVMVDAPAKAGWGRRQWLTAVGLTVLLAGPWFLRNLVLTGNPLYPLEVQLFGHRLLPGLFATERSERLRTIRGAWRVFVGGYHGIPPALVAPLAIGWIGSVVALGRRWREPLVRAAVVGPAICLILFLAKAPYGEVRFLFPAMLVALAAVALLGRLGKWGPRASVWLAGVILALSIYTTYESRVLVAVALAPCGLLVGAAALLMWIDARLGGAVRRRMWMAAVVFLAFWGSLYLIISASTSGTESDEPALLIPLACCAVVVFAGVALGWSDVRLGKAPRGRLYFAAISVAAFGAVAFVLWKAYVATIEYHAPEFWSRAEFYPTLAPGWVFLRENVPPDATIAYAQTFLIYPLYGSALQRHVNYAPVRPDVTDVLHLPHFPRPLSGEPINDTFTALLNAPTDRAIWLQRLKAAGAQYLFVYLAGPDKAPPEDRFARGTSEFSELFRNPNVVIYRLNP